VNQDRPVVSATWLPPFALVVLVLLLLIVGGVSASKTRSWRMYPNINPWAIGKPSPRLGHQMVLGSDGSLWVFGEYCADKKGGCRTSSDLFKLDFGAKEWTTITTSGVSPSARTYHTMASTDGFLWVFGGETLSVAGEERSVLQPIPKNVSSFSLMCFYCQYKKISEQPCSNEESEGIQCCGKFDFDFDCLLFLSFCASTCSVFVPPP
jgi:hypothetical protein